MNFACMSCGVETRVAIRGNVSVICQSCGCVDVKFSQDFGITQVGFNGPYKIQLVRANEPFLGRHKEGLIWRLDNPPPHEELRKEPAKEEIKKEVQKVELKKRRK